MSGQGLRGQAESSEWSDPGPHPHLLPHTRAWRWRPRPLVAPTSVGAHAEWEQTLAFAARPGRSALTKAPAAPPGPRVPPQTRPLHLCSPTRPRAAPRLWAPRSRLTPRRNGPRQTREPPPRSLPARTPLHAVGPGRRRGSEWVRGPSGGRGVKGRAAVSETCCPNALRRGMGVAVVGVSPCVHTRGHRCAVMAGDRPPDGPPGHRCDFNPRFPHRERGRAPSQVFESRLPFPARGLCIPCAFPLPRPQTACLPY